MTDAPKPFPPQLNRCCPSCRYLITQVDIDALVCNVRCPRCGKHTTNEFVRTHAGPLPPESP